MGNKTFGRSLYDYFIDNWVLSPLIATAPIYWFTFIQLFGENLGLVVDGKLTPIASFIYWPFFIVSGIFSFAMSLADKYNEKAKQDGQFVLGKMLDGANTVLHTKLRRYIDYIINDHYRDKKILNPFVK